MTVLLSLWALIPEREFGITQASAVNPWMTMCFLRPWSFVAAYRVFVSKSVSLFLRYPGSFEQNDLLLLLAKT